MANTRTEARQAGRRGGSTCSTQGRDRPALETGVLSSERGLLLARATTSAPRAPVATAVIVGALSPVLHVEIPEHLPVEVEHDHRGPDLVRRGALEPTRDHPERRSPAPRPRGAP